MSWISVVEAAAQKDGLLMRAKWTNLVNQEYRSIETENNRMFQEIGFVK